ncbi:MAG: MFS transporter, partial [Cyanobacteriota bacterium]|nr:MFS transporter [Cyanobacteriota bacterium]
MQVVALIYLVQVVHIPSELSTWMLLPFQISALVGLQIWSLFSNRFGRLSALRWGSGFWISACLFSIVIKPIPDGFTPLQLAPLLAMIIFVGFGASTAYLIPWSLLPDAIDADPGKPAGLYTTWMIFTQKLVIGFSMVLFGAILSLSGYLSPKECSGALTFLEQPPSAIITIRLCMGFIPAVLVALGLVVMRGWPERNSHNQAAMS